MSKLSKTTGVSRARSMQEREDENKTHGNVNDHLIYYKYVSILHAVSLCHMTAAVLITYYKRTTESTT